MWRRCIERMRSTRYTWSSDDREKGLASRWEAGHGCRSDPWNDRPREPRAEHVEDGHQAGINAPSRTPRSIRSLASQLSYVALNRIQASTTVRFSQWQRRRKNRGRTGELIDGDTTSCPTDLEFPTCVAFVPAHGVTPCRSVRHQIRPIFSGATFWAIITTYWAATSTFTNAIVGDGICRATGPSLFKVECSKGGLYLDASGKSAYKRCSPRLCPVFEAPANSVLVPLLGADPANLKIGEKVEFKCNSGYVYRGRDNETNGTECRSNPVCTLKPHKQCVFDTFCSVFIDRNGNATAKWWNKENRTEDEATRESTSHPTTNLIFNREFVTTQCNAGYRSSLPYSYQSPWSADGMCKSSHTIMCRESDLSYTSGQLEKNASCIPITCPRFNTTCNDASICGSDFGREIATVTPNTTLSVGQSATIRCNAGYYLPESTSFTPDCSSVLSSGVLTSAYTQTWTATCSSKCNYNAPPRPCEPLPCSCVEVPGNATPSTQVCRSAFIPLS